MPRTETTTIVSNRTPSSFEPPLLYTFSRLGPSVGPLLLEIPMPTDRILLDAWHLQLFVASTEPDAAVDAIRQTLDRKGFRRAVRRAVRRVLRRHPRLASLTVTLTR